MGVGACIVCALVVDVVENAENLLLQERLRMLGQKRKRKVQSGIFSARDQQSLKDTHTMFVTQHILSNIYCNMK